MQFTGPALQGPIPSNNTSIRALGFRYKGFGENGTREYGNCANRHAISLYDCRETHSNHNPPGQLYLATKPEILSDRAPTDPVQTVCPDSHASQSVKSGAPR